MFKTPTTKTPRRRKGKVDVVKTPHHSQKKIEKLDLFRRQRRKWKKLKHQQGSISIAIDKAGPLSNSVSVLASHQSYSMSSKDPFELRPAG